MGGASRKPDHVVGVVYRLIVRRVLAQPGIVDRAVRVFAFRITLIRVVAGHPQLPIHKAQTVVNPFLLAKIGPLGDRVRPSRIRYQLIGNRVTHLVQPARVAEQADSGRIEFLCRLLFGGDLHLIDLHGAGTRAAPIVRLHIRVQLHQAVIFAIDIHIQPEVVNVLVGGADNVVID